MLDGFLLNWNQVAGVILAAVVNALPASILLTVAGWVLMLFCRSWTAASRYWVWWIVLVFVVAITAAHPFLPDYSKPFRTRMSWPNAPGKHVSAIHSNSVTTTRVASPALRIGNSGASSFTVSSALLFIWILVSAVQFARLGLAFGIRGT